MARSSLEPLVAPGKGAKDKKSQAILASALGRYAERGGGSVQGLIELLREPPEDVTDGYKDGEKIAKELSELLLSAIRTDPLLGGSGEPLDPEQLLRSSTPGKVRISVINLVGLPGQDSQQKFINQLAMTLFTWIKKNPAKNGALLGLLVIDEAKDFVPSGKSVACREQRLTSRGSGSKIRPRAAVCHSGPEEYRPSNRGELFDAAPRQAKLSGCDRCRPTTPTGEGVGWQ
ncbi:MAG: hypothetical protein QM784_39220 [Polyangiaceae bacterium]